MQALGHPRQLARLPGFIAMCPGGYPIQESQNWQSAFAALIRPLFILLAVVLLIMPVYLPAI